MSCGLKPGKGVTRGIVEVKVFHDAIEQSFAQSAELGRGFEFEANVDGVRTLRKTSLAVEFEGWEVPWLLLLLLLLGYS